MDLTSVILVIASLGLVATAITFGVTGWDITILELDRDNEASRFESKRSVIRMNGYLVAVLSGGMILGAAVALVTESASLSEATLTFVIGCVLLWFSVRYAKWAQD